eukprot:CAMPEP_0204822342 /NCGR_PEP_ID=MMETSP1346-20131115/535_1 /ASSEMBLY_ACC=CAM_ASM_000771 /TAXON_ID=215587 /ORGANISM="Aplanochytrium stocchinoi, Strain GSBS06" /LENGTH=411 /DNA_ID=CAMNT_0051948507 /DNA_START=297 /DNA_END=1532 /DNA_ORIENTATION=+
MTFPTKMGVNTSPEVPAGANVEKNIKCNFANVNPTAKPDWEPLLAEQGKAATATDTLPSTNGNDEIAVFYCKRCREPLFEANNLSQHAEGMHEISRRKKWKDAHTNKKAASSSTESETQCLSYFLLEAPVWMLKEEGPNSESFVSEVEGKIVCPNHRCAAKFGNYAWSGAQCSCGTWICPAIQVPKSKVDKRFLLASKVPERIRPNATPSQESEDQVVIEESHDYKDSFNMESLILDPQNKMGSAENGKTASSPDVREMDDKSVTYEAKLKELLENHRKWLHAVRDGDITAMKTFLSTAYCSLETVRGKELIGLDIVAKNLEETASNLSGRIRILSEPVALEESPKAKRKSGKRDDDEDEDEEIRLPVAIGSKGVFGVLAGEGDEIKTRVSETIWWNTKENQAVQIIRAKT